MKHFLSIAPATKDQLDHLAKMEGTDAEGAYRPCPTTIGTSGRILRAFPLGSLYIGIG